MSDKGTLDEVRTAADIAAELSDPVDGYDTANASDDLYYLLAEVERLREKLHESVERYQKFHENLVAPLNAEVERLQAAWQASEAQVNLLTLWMVEADRLLVSDKAR